MVGPLSQKLGRAPRPSEIAEQLGISVDEVVAALEAQQAYRSSSMDELADASDTPMAERLGSVDAELDQVEYRESLLPLLDELPERSRTIVVLRFFGNQTQTQIAATRESRRCTSPGCARSWPSCGSG